MNLTVEDRATMYARQILGNVNHGDPQHEVYVALTEAYVAGYSTAQVEVWEEGTTNHTDGSGDHG